MGSVSEGRGLGGLRCNPNSEEGAPPPQPPRPASRRVEAFSEEVVGSARWCSSRLSRRLLRSGGSLPPTSLWRRSARLGLSPQPLFWLTCWRSQRRWDLTPAQGSWPRPSQSRHLRGGLVSRGLWSTFPARHSTGHPTSSTSDVKEPLAGGSDWWGRDGCFSV